MKVRIYTVLLCVVFVMSGLFIMGAAKPGPAFDIPPSYLTSATYYSDDWVVNFWNSESRHMDQELQQIASDGFNSIILVVPWREFQPDMEKLSYNSYALKKLDRVMELAAKHGLWVVLRIGYTWDYNGPKSSVLNRYESLIYDKKVRGAWIDYARVLYGAASVHKNFYGGFITWEDFWYFTETATKISDRNTARKLAGSCGFRDYLREHYSLKELSGFYGEEFTGYYEIYLPLKNHPAAFLFYDFYDSFLNQLLLQTQEVFEGLSFEARLDGECLYKQDGTPYHYAHEATYSGGNAAYTSAMFSIAMGQANQGERVSAEQGILASASYMQHVAGLTGGKPLYLDQFLFTDNTPGFAHNAQIEPDQTGSYLMGMLPALRSYTMGYGIWTYRNYGNNQLYNTQFALGLKGWRYGQGVEVVIQDGSPAARIPDGQKLQQSFHDELDHNGGGPTSVRFRTGSESRGRLEVCIGPVRETVEVDGSRDYELTYPFTEADSISFISRGEVYIDDIYVYSHVQNGQLYDEKGKELQWIRTIRSINKYLN